MEPFKISISESDIKANINEIVETLITGLSEKNDTLPFLERVFKALPELRNEIYPGLTKKDMSNIVQEVISDRYKNEDEKIKIKISTFRTLTKERLYDAIQELLSIYEMIYDKEQSCFCYLGFYNPFPRNVVLKEYYLHYNISNEVFMRSSLHEINHMILFDKWKKVHGAKEQINHSYPDTLWFLEELAIEPTLNDPRIQKIIPIRHHAYDSFNRIIIDGIPLTSQIQNIYNNTVHINEFLDCAYQYIENHKELIISHRCN